MEVESGDAGAGGAVAGAGAALVSGEAGVPSVDDEVDGAGAVVSGVVVGKDAGLAEVKVTPSTLYFWRSALKVASICM